MNPKALPIVLSIIGSCSFGSLQTQAAALDTLSPWTGASTHTFGELSGQVPGGVTFGQTFKLPAGDWLATGLSFGVIGYAPYTAPEVCKFECFIMDWNGSGPAGPVRYQSSPQVMPSGFYPNVIFNLALDNTPLVGGNQYVVFFTENNFLNGIRSDAAMYTVNNIYSGGDFVVHYSGFSFNDVLSQNWQTLSYLDLAFRLEYTAVPEPGLPLLLLMGSMVWAACNVTRPKRSLLPNRW